MERALKTEISSIFLLCQSQFMTFYGQRCFMCYVSQNNPQRPERAKRISLSCLFCFLIYKTLPETSSRLPLMSHWSELDLISLLAWWGKLLWFWSESHELSWVWVEVWTVLENVCIGGGTGLRGCLVPHCERQRVYAFLNNREIHLRHDCFR